MLGGEHNIVLLGVFSISCRQRRSGNKHAKDDVDYNDLVNALQWYNYCSTVLVLRNIILLSTP